MKDTSYLANVPSETIHAAIEMWERHVLVEPNDTSDLMKEIKKRLKEYKVEANRRAVLAQQPATAKADSEADYQQAIRNLRETVAALKSEMHEVAYALEYGDITPQDAAKRLESALNG